MKIEKKGIQNYELVTNDTCIFFGLVKFRKRAANPRYLVVCFCFCFFYMLFLFCRKIHWNSLQNWMGLIQNIHHYKASIVRDTNIVFIRWYKVKNIDLLFFHEFFVGWTKWGSFLRNNHWLLHLITFSVLQYVQMYIVAKFLDNFVESQTSEL